MVRPALALLAVAAALLAPGADVSRAAVGEPTFAFSGRGWGHGVGMSQWGAYGFAVRGWTYDRILAHYYRGTVLDRAPVARVRVLLAEGRKTLTVSSAAAFRVRDGAGELHE